MDLHGQIMNLTAARNQHYDYANTVIAYLCGERDTRHAAAELALKADAAVEAMQAEIDRLRSDSARQRYALDLIVRRMQMNIDDGSRLEKTTMERLVNRAQAALSEEAKGTT